DGIRDFHVTGVQTCALPIFTAASRATGIPSPMPGPIPDNETAAVISHGSRSSLVSVACPSASSRPSLRPSVPSKRADEPSDVKADRKSVGEGKSEGEATGLA